ncbi:MAG: alpha/beta fold hydrolase [Anaerolineae bacterium]|nr:alpha/beta fold hydrolase [Anaerolineae bacterium]
MKVVQRLIFVGLFLLVSIGQAVAQDATATPASPIVKVTASDGQVLVGDYIPATGQGDHPAVLLMHMYQSIRQSWKDFVPELTKAGYNVLNVDLRGHGATGGPMNWSASVTDVQTWLDWLRAQPNVRASGVSIIGASVGSNLAIIGCANDKQCATVIALSPGANYFDLQPNDFIVKGLRDRSALLVASQKDEPSISGVKQFTATAQGEIGVQLFAGNLHGTAILNSPVFKKRLTAMMINWLNDHTPKV